MLGKMSGKLIVSSLLMHISLVGLAESAAPDSATLNSATRSIEEARLLISQDQAKAALRILDTALVKHVDNHDLLVLTANQAFQMGFTGKAELLARRASKVEVSEASQLISNKVAKKFAKLSGNPRIAIVALDKYLDSGDFVSAASLGKKVLKKWPDNELFLVRTGAAVYAMDDLEQAEGYYIKALNINPRNAEVKAKINDIRVTKAAKVTELSSQIKNIARDKVGDFIVTFLALFTAFLTSTLIQPVVLRIKLKRARNSFEQGDYDQFTDLIEGLLDLENFTPIRSNFQFVLRKMSFNEAKAILQKHVVTLERLPTLIRILEREHEKKLAAEAR